MIRSILKYSAETYSSCFMRIPAKSCMERLYAQTQTFSQGRIPSQSIRKPSLRGLGCGLVGSVFYKIYSAPFVRAEEAKCLPEKVIWTWPEGTKYEGDALGGLLHGKGKILFTNGDQYEGDFRNGEMHGKGKFTFRDGATYEGDLLNNKITGKGRFIYACGEQYEGDVLDGNLYGQGVYSLRKKGV